MGYEVFRGERYFVDRRAYITDHVTSYMVDAVVERAQQIHAETTQPVSILELGVGCGSLAISVKKEMGEKARVCGLDIDGAALELARKNCDLNHVDIELIESDLLRSYPHNTVPDIIFGDPPWGDETSIYDEERPWEHYQAMPPMSVSPLGGLIQIHEQILKSILDKKWSTNIFLNTGTLEDHYLHRLGEFTSHYEIVRPSKGISIFFGKIFQNIFT